MAEPVLVDPRGRPLRQGVRELSRPWATATLTGVRRAWDSASIASGLTPEVLAGTLRQADEGDPRAYLTLAMEMESREAHYRSVLGVRKQAVLRLPVTVEAATDEPADIALADEIRALVRAPGFRLAKSHLLDALGKGYCAVEMRWDTTRTPWLPRDRVDRRTGERIAGYEWIDPRWLRYDRETGRVLRLLDDQDMVNGIPLPAYRYLIHEPPLASGQPHRRGLARTALVAYMAKSFGLGDWLRFADSYGLPLRVGKYGSGASQEDISILVRAVANLGTDWGAVMPDSMVVDLVQPQSGSGSGVDLFERLALWADRQMSKLVLGQVASSEGQPGALGGQEIQNEVRSDIRDADGEDLAETLNRDLVGSYLELNHGAIDPEDAPRIVIAEPDREDIGTLVDALAALVPLGLRVEASVIRDKLGLPDPDTGPDVELLGVPQPAMDTSDVIEGADATRIEPNRAGVSGPSPAEIIGEQMAASGEAHVGAWVSEYARMAQQASTLEELRGWLLTAFGRAPVVPLADMIGDARMAAHAAGRFDVEEQAR